MRRFFPLLLAACAMPPRVEDQSTPERSYETFRGAIARNEYDRAYGTLSDQLRAKFRLESRGQFTDAWIVGAGVEVKAIRRSKAKGPAEPLKDGRALLRIRVRFLFFGEDVRIWFRPVPVVRVYVKGKETADFYQHLDRLEIVEKDGVLGVKLDPELIAALEEGRGQMRRFEAGIEWFLDDFEVGKERERSE
ncbi:MAG: hypothetical protein ACHQ1G_03760 [Planctomycetota bacterium]